MTVTLARAIHDLATIIGAVAHDGIAKATFASGTLVDSMLYQADDTWNDYVAYIYEGTGAGQERNVSDFTSSTTTATITPVWTTVPDVTSKYILLNPGFRVYMLRQALLLALIERRRYHMVPKIDTSLTINMTPTATYEYTVPTGYATIQQINREDDVSAGTYNNELPSFQTWTIKKDTTKKIVFDKALNDKVGFLKHNCKLLLIGQQYDTTPTLDTDSISIAMGATMLLAAANASMAYIPQDIQNTQQRTKIVEMFLAQYTEKKWEDVSPAYPDSQWVEDV